MSSVRIDVSGARGLTTTVNSPESTSAQMATKVDDNVSVNLGNMPGFTLIVPPNARLVRARTKSGSEYVVLECDNTKAASLQIYAVHPDPDDTNPMGTWPHASISLGKHLKNPYAPGGGFEVETLEVIHERIGDLIPTTE